jgi:hypothetical protein
MFSRVMSRSPLRAWSLKSGIFFVNVTDVQFSGKLDWRSVFALRLVELLSHPIAKGSECCVASLDSAACLQAAVGGNGEESLDLVEIHDKAQSIEKFDGNG